MQVELETLQFVYVYDVGDAVVKSAAQLVHDTQTLAASINDIEPFK
jgi:hypothetical protein